RKLSGSLFGRGFDSRHLHTRSTNAPARPGAFSICGHPPPGQKSAQRLQTAGKKLSLQYQKIRL
ncbi:hypothetical protein, partial [uncultured Alistipes sp.]|uniref:hypothetical protein n=1 Tax=uncultured Alistipes sp. TaxID=538949 RepID=UPI00266C7012